MGRLSVPLYPCLCIFGSLIFYQVLEYIWAGKFLRFCFSFCLSHITVTPAEEVVLVNEEGTGALDLAWMINGATEYGYDHFSPETNAISKQGLLEGSNPGNLFWGTGKDSVLAETHSATVSLLAKAEEEDPSFDEEISVYQAALAQQQGLLADMVAQETTAMEDLCALME